jgi:cytochrome P450
MTDMEHGIIGGLPTARQSTFDPPEQLGLLRAQRPIAPMTYPDGHQGWVVTGYAQARKILADPRFSAKAELKHPPIPPDGAAVIDPQAVPPGQFAHMDPPEHTRFRRVLAAQFTVRRIEQLKARIQRICDDQVDRMVDAGPPADLVTAFALPVPALVICELLGVPYADRHRFETDVKRILSIDLAHEEAMASLGNVTAFLGALAQRKRAEPSDDLLSGMVAGGELTDEEITGAALLLLIAGYETTANMLSLGIYALLCNPDQLAALRSGAASIDNAVEELLRYLSIVHFGTQRVPLEDVEIDGFTMKAGEAVQLHLPAANRDPLRFAEPDVLDLARGGAGHVAFGYGVHQCLGAQLARMEMRIGYDTLLRRLPEFRLAVPPDEIGMCSDMGLYGVRQLPLTW